MPEKNVEQAKSGASASGRGGGSGGGGGGEQDRILKLECELARVTGMLEGVIRGNDLGAAIGNGVHELERIFAPLRAIAPTRELSPADARNIADLRGSLRRPDFSGLEGAAIALPPDPKIRGGAA